LVSSEDPAADYVNVHPTQKAAEANGKYLAIETIPVHSFCLPFSPAADNGE
jgi:hypothetical protein